MDTAPSRKMTPNRWQQVNELFSAVIELEPAQRAAFLDQACVNDPELRRELDSLLAFDKNGCDFIDKVAVEVAAPLLAEDQPRLRAGQPISHYEVLRLIGKGGMGEVYLATDKLLQRRVALKLLPVDYTVNRDRLRRFQQEAQSASALNHPNILTIHELGAIDDQQFIATEFVDGETLRERMKSGPLSVRESLDISIQVASALEAAHKAGIIHRDIKPENIMLRPDGYIKVLDFGLAKLTEPLPVTSDATQPRSNTDAGLVVGTVKYMSPEQARGLVVDARSDIFSLTVVLYEMLTGRAPFEGETASDLLATVLKDDPSPLSEYLGDYPETLQEIINKGLNKDKKHRYVSISELIDSLRTVKDQVDSQFKTERLTEVGLFGLQQSSSRPFSATWGGRFGSSAEFLVSEMKQHKSLAGVAMAVLFVATLSLGYVTYRFFRVRSPAVPHMSLTRLTLGGLLGNAAISPDGKYIAYVSSVGGLQSLWMRQVATNSSAQIMPPSKLEYGAVTFSPDGNYLFYAASTESEEGALYSVPVIGGTSKLVIDGIANSGPVTFAPDNKRLAFVRQYPSGETALFVSNIDGTEQRKIASRQGTESLANAAWSPDGQWIACTEGFHDADSMRWKLITIEPEVGTEAQIKIPAFRSVGEIVWLTDGKGLLMIAGNEGEPMQVWEVSYPDGTTTNVVNDIGSYSGLSLTADGKVLVTNRLEVISNIWNQAGQDLADAKQITSGAGVRDGWMGIDWTPDGRIVYSSHASGQPDIWIMNADGSNPQQLTNNMGSVYDGLTVSPDGKYVVFVSRRAGNTNLWRIDIDGRNPKQLTSGAGEFHPFFLPDSQWVRYSSGGKTWKVPIDGGQPVPYGDGFPPTLGISVSPDGQLSAYLDKKTPKGIGVAPSAGGDAIAVLRLPPNAQISGQMRWTPDSRALTFVAAQNDVSNIWSQPIDGGPPRQLTDFKADSIKSFAWSRDGKQLVIARGTRSSNLMLIRNFGTQGR